MCIGQTHFNKFLHKESAQVFLAKCRGKGRRKGIRLRINFHIPKETRNDIMIKRGGNHTNYFRQIYKKKSPHQNLSGLSKQFKHLKLSCRFNRLDYDSSYFVGICSRIWTAVFEIALPAFFYGNYRNSNRSTSVRNTITKIVDRSSFMFTR